MSEADQIRFSRWWRKKLLDDLYQHDYPSTDAPRQESAAWHRQHGDWELSSSGTPPAPSSEQLLHGFEAIRFSSESEF